MALERSNPLPQGRYWVHVAPSDRIAFNVWLQSNREALKVRSSQALADGWQWVLFEVVAPAMVFWQGPGYPTIADDSVRSETDVVQVPVIEGSTPADFAGKILRAAAPWALAALLGVAVINRVGR